MPGPAVHLLVLADLEAELAALAGGRAAQARRALSCYPAHAALGAIGPDLFYLAGPPGLAWAEWAAHLLAEAAQPFASLLAGHRRRTEGVGRMAAATVPLRAAIARLEAHLASDLAQRVFAEGFDLLARLRPALQDGRPEAGWNWGDLLHYRQTGRFAGALLEHARAAGRPELLAYALGYASHVAADAYGHAFVNTIVGGPYRLHYHRHRLVEAHMDAWAWHARLGHDLAGAGMAGRIDVGPYLPVSLRTLLQTALAAVYAGGPRPALSPDMNAAYLLLRRLLAALTGGDWRQGSPPAARGMANALWRHVCVRHQEVRMALVEVGLAYPAPHEVEPLLCRAPAGLPDPGYPRASIHVPGQPNLASPRVYPPTPPDGLAALLNREGTPYPGPPWRASLHVGCMPDAFMLPAARTAAAYCLGAVIPDLNLDADPVEGVGCWRALGDLRSAAYRLQEL